MSILSYIRNYSSSRALKAKLEILQDEVNTLADLVDKRTKRASHAEDSLKRTQDELKSLTKKFSDLGLKHRGTYKYIDEIGVDLTAAISINRVFDDPSQSFVTAIAMLGQPDVHVFHISDAKHRSIVAKFNELNNARIAHAMGDYRKDRSK